MTSNCHTTFFLKKFLTLNSFRKQFQRSIHSVNAGKLLRLNTYHCFYFNSNALKIELQYQWTPPQIFFCRYRLLQLFSHNVEGAYDIECSLKQFCWFQRLGSKFTRGKPRRWSMNMGVLKKFRNFDRKTAVPESLFRLKLY